MSTLATHASKQTLLDITQNILRLLKDDEVNSISDTTRAYDVAKIVEDAYFEYVLSEDIPEHKALVQLGAVSDLTRPTLMRIPDGVSDLHSVQYDSRKVGETRVQYRTICYEMPVDFLRRVYSRNSTLSTVTTQTLLNPDGMPVYVYNDRAPQYWTTFDDYYLVFDSYDGTIEDTLQNSKSVAQGKRTPEFCLEDDFVMDLSLTAAKYVEKRATTLAFDVMKGAVPSQIARAEKKFKNRINNNKSSINESNPWGHTPSQFGRYR